jgi:hypothetical protein
LRHDRDGYRDPLRRLYCPEPGPDALIAGRAAAKNHDENPYRAIPA